MHVLLSISVGNKKLYGVEGQFAGGRLTVSRFGELRIDEGETVSDGAVKNKLRLSTALNHLHAVGRFTTRRAVLTVNSSYILSRRLELPQAKPKEIVQMARNEMVQLVGNADDYVYDCACLQSAGGKTCAVWAYAVPNDLVDSYAQAAADAGLKTVALDVCANSVEKLFLFLARNGELPTAKLLVELDDRGAEIHLFSGGERVFSRLAPVTTAEIESLLENTGDISEEDTGQPLRGRSFTNDLFMTDAILRDAVHRYFAALAGELQKIVRFQQRRAQDDPVQAVSLYGRLATVEGISSLLQDALGLPVNVVDTLPALTAPAGFRPTEYVSALGALIRLK